ncbi:alanine--tRNA ligase [Patescibacteria group bacterium]|nr:alanine--tRNA ligase [Patescibacteria group bacterium]
MKSYQIRKLFLDFFEKNGHKIVPSSSLLPSDPSVLFTTAGMQQFKSYYLGEKSPYGSDVASCQKCFRTTDIEEVGDEKHLTFFEMLGNFSFGGYFKEKAIKLAYEFIVNELKLDIDYVTIFSSEKVADGDWRKNIPEDKDSYKIWRDVGLPENKIRKEGIDNFWGPTGDDGPCGVTTEIYVNGIEVWNLVFNEYFCNNRRELKKIDSPGLDTGSGLERLVAVVQEKNTIFETDLFETIIGEISGQDERAKRIIADHIRSVVFLISEGILPLNLGRGYILRRLIRRAARYGKLLNLPKNFLIPLAKKTIEIYKEVYPEIKLKESDILTVIQYEEEKFEKTLERGLREIEKILNLTGETAFLIYETFGFPLELIEEIRKVENREEFFVMKKKHQEISRAGAEKKFGGVGKEATEEVIKLHTATHLLQAALRKILGEHVKQMGSDITSQRLRFDFSHNQKMTQEEIKKVEDLVNKKIEEDLEIKKEELSYEEAIESGALAFFKEKYPEIVNVYSIGDFSKEICGGPHISRTSELKGFRIIKEESSGAGIRRIKAVLG